MEIKLSYLNLIIQLSNTGLQLNDHQQLKLWPLKSSQPIVLLLKSVFKLMTHFGFEWLPSSTTTGILTEAVSRAENWMESRREEAISRTILERWLFGGVTNDCGMYEYLSLLQTVTSIWAVWIASYSLLPESLIWRFKHSNWYTVVSYRWCSLFVFHSAVVS